MNPGSGLDTNGFGCPASAVVLHHADQVQLRPGGAARALQPDLRVGDLQPRLSQVGTVRERVGNQILHRPDLVRRRNGQRIGRNDARAGHFRILIARAA